MKSKAILVDTSLVIDLLRRQDKQNSWLYDLAIQRVDISASILTHTEFYSGASVWDDKKAKQDLEKILKGIKLIGVSESISKQGGKLRMLNSIDLVDAIIAATAVENDLPLATLNPKHFKKIAGLRLAEKVLKYKN